ncbi:MAG: alpha/beta fold hydrolase [Dehalococcoidia bacterium]
MVKLEVTGGELYYEVHGSGPDTIVFAHGGGGNHISWYQQIPHFRGRFRCITFDHRGFGQSADHSGEARAAFGRDLDELLKHLNIESVVLVAQSMGGFTCLPFAVKNPRRVKALLMADTFLGIWDEHLLAEMAKAVEAAVGSAAAGAQTRMLGPSFVRDNPTGTFLYQQLRELTPPRPTSGTALSFGVESGAVLPEQLSSLTMPVQFIAGEHDEIIPSHLIEAASRMVPGASFLSVPDAGHSVYFEKPQVFNRILDDLLSSI